MMPPAAVPKEFRELETEAQYADRLSGLSERDLLILIAVDLRYLVRREREREAWGADIHRRQSRAPTPEDLRCKQRLREARAQETA
jgi:hypothetical protein